MRRLSTTTQEFSSSTPRLGFSRVANTKAFESIFKEGVEEENFESTFTVVFKTAKKKIKSYLKTKVKPKIGKSTWFSRYWKKNKKAFLNIVLQNGQFKEKMEKHNWYEQTKEMLKKKLYNMIRNKIRKLKRKYPNYPDSKDEVAVIEWFKTYY